MIEILQIVQLFDLHLEQFAQGIGRLSGPFAGRGIEDFDPEVLQFAADAFDLGLPFGTKRQIEITVDSTLQFEVGGTGQNQNQLRQIS